MDKFKGWTEAFKNLFSLFRDLLLFGLLILLAIYPEGLNDRLMKAGITTIHGPGFDWAAKTKEAKQTSLAAAAAVDQSRSDNLALSKKPDAAIASDPHLKAQIAPLQASLADSNASLSAAITHLTSAIVVQQNALQAANAPSSPLIGWVYLGTLDPGRSRWMGPDKTTNLRWPIANGALAQALGQVA